MNPEKRRRIFERLRAANPSPTTELAYRTPFELLVAVILSAQATDKGVNLATGRLYPRASTPEKILALGMDGLIEYIRTIGLYRSKATHILETCRLLLERHQGKVPDSREALEALPGVGRKTANVILNTAFGQPTIAVDTHIFRVANRTGIAPGKDVRAVEDKLSKFVPEEFRAHHWLILHGRYVCKARKPDCPVCIIRDLCEYRHKTIGDGPQNPNQQESKQARRAVASAQRPEACSTLPATRSASSFSIPGKNTGQARRWRAWKASRSR